MGMFDNTQQRIHCMSMKFTFYSILSVFVCLGVFMPLGLLAQEVPGCGSLENAYGPFDYRDPSFVDNLRLVEIAHFTPSVESLTRGNTAIRPGHDLDYTLRAFPNHHRALNAVARHQLQYPGGPPPKMRYTAECYFERAIHFTPDDAMVRMLRGNYHAKSGSYKKALKDYQEALRLEPESAEIHYNIGLLYVKLKDYKEARSHAQRAYQYGYPLPGLRNQLKRMGKW